MEIKHVKDNSTGSFQALENGREIGILAYTGDGNNRFTIHHTEVIPEFEGKGIGKKLVEEAVQFARENKLKIIPVCTYAKRLIEKSREMQDVLYKS